MTTRSTWLLGGLLLAALATACGDDGGNNPTNTCGDGALGGAETCDDGNTSSGDGCSATCQTEGPASCGNGAVDTGETCDDGNTTDGDGCSATCQTEGVVTCGDGVIDTAEGCDDDNTAAGDGCSATCAVEDGFVCTGEPSVCGMPSGSCAAPYVVTLTNTAGVLSGAGTGDTTAGTSQVADASCNSGTAGAGPDHVWQFTLTDTRDVEIEIADTTAFDSVLRIMAAPCDVATEIPEFTGADGCSDITGAGEFLAYVALPAGTYYVVIDGFEATDLGAYSFTLTARATECGDGALDATGYEFCDDSNTTPGDGCSDKCEVETGYTCDDAEPSVCVMACGNGILDAGEECEDGNLVAGDRCSATCTLEYDVLEVEPNGTIAQSVTAVDHIIRGTLDANDVDLYTFTLTEPATVQIETYNSMDNLLNYTGAGTIPNIDCASLDTVINFFDPTGDLTMAATALYSDDDDGDLSCSYIGPNDEDGDTTQGVLLPAGTYTFSVVMYDPTDAGYYLVDLQITPELSAPVAGDLVLNEFMAADNLADTNCDMSTTDTVDEFVELVNVSNKTLDLTGVTIAESNGVRFTFAPAATGSMTLEPGKAVVVWGGGAPACPGVTNWFVAPNGLALTDAGDTITVATGDTVPVQLLTYTYPAATILISSNLSPDVTGTVYALHNAVTGAVGNFTPGKRANNTAF